MASRTVIIELPKGGYAPVFKLRDPLRGDRRFDSIARQLGVE